MTHTQIKWIQRALVILTAVLIVLEIELEPGVTWNHDHGICVEDATGEEGIITFDGQCMTPTDYDEIFSYENLDTIPDCPMEKTDCTLEEYPSIAENYGVTPDDDPASDRPLGEGLVEPGTETSFKEKVAAVHALHLPIPS